LWEEKGKADHQSGAMAALARNYAVNEWDMKDMISKGKNLG